MAYSPSTSTATTVRKSSGDIHGIAYDARNDRIYWSDSKVYRAPAHDDGRTNPTDVVLDNFEQC